MIKININKAKEISHNIRREARAKEFEPLDEVIMKQIPGTVVEVVEAERQLIRYKYAEIQTQIDAAEDAEQLLTIVNTIKGE
jgi:hypothetical protein